MLFHLLNRLFSKEFPSDRKGRPNAKIDSTTKFEALEAVNEYSKPCILVADENSAFTGALSKGLVQRGFSCYVTENKSEVFSLFLLKRPVVTVLWFNV